MGDRETFESDGRAGGERSPHAHRQGEPDICVDLPQLRVEEVNLEVDDLTANVSVQANVLDLLRLHVGAHASIGRVQFGINTVEAQAQVKVRLDDLLAIVDRVLTTIDRNPQIIERLAQGVGQAVEQVGQGTGEAVGDIGEGASSAARDIGRGARSAVEDVGQSAEAAVANASKAAR